MLKLAGIIAASLMNTSFSKKKFPVKSWIRKPTIGGWSKWLRAGYFAYNQ